MAGSWNTHTIIAQTINYAADNNILKSWINLKIWVGTPSFEHACVRKSIFILIYTHPLNIEPERAMISVFPSFARTARLPKGPISVSS